MTIRRSQPGAYLAPRRATTRVPAGQLGSETPVESDLPHPPPRDPRSRRSGSVLEQARERSPRSGSPSSSISHTRSAPSSSRPGKAVVKSPGTTPIGCQADGCRTAVHPPRGVRRQPRPGSVGRGVVDHQDLASRRPRDFALVAGPARVSRGEAVERDHDRDDAGDSVRRHGAHPRAEPLVSKLAPRSSDSLAAYPCLREPTEPPVTDAPTASASRASTSCSRRLQSGLAPGAARPRRRWPPQPCACTNGDVGIARC
jgi:hypothetical protein